MLKFEYLTFKTFPINLGSSHRGIIRAKSRKKAEKSLEKKNRYALIVRQI